MKGAYKSVSELNYMVGGNSIIYIMTKYIKMKMKINKAVDKTKRLTITRRVTERWVLQKQNLSKRLFVYIYND
jgi:translation initiation factor 2 gamma subunit (eIF-2gamma)